MTFAILHVAALILTAAPGAPPQWTPAALMRMKRVGSVQVSPDGKQVVFTVREAVMEGNRSEYLTHLYLAGQDGGDDRRLTEGDQSCDDPQWSPNGRWVAFASSRSGKRNLWVIAPDGGEARQITDVKTGVGTYRWAPDGRSLAFTAADPPTRAEEAAARAKSDAHVVGAGVRVLRLRTVPFTSPPMVQREDRTLTGADMNVGRPEGMPTGRAPFDWSPNGKTVVFSHTRSPAADDWATADISVVDVASGKVRPLAHTAAAETSPLYSPDGASIAYVASDDPPSWADGGRIHVIPAAGGAPQTLADTADGFGRYSELVGWAADGKSLYFTEAHGTSLRLLALPLQGAPVEISHDEGMASAGVFLNARRTHFGFAWETAKRPPEAFVSTAEHYEPLQISHVQTALPDAPCRTEITRWKSKDGLEIEGLLTYPVGYGKGERYPLLVVVHGGPMGDHTQTYDGTPTYYPIAAFAARGYAVLRPNVRGGAGYGKKFRRANFGDWGGGDFQDLMAGVDAVIDMGVADPDRLGVMGWSYGGYMTTWAVTQTHRFRAASAGGAVTDLVSFTGTADIPGFLPDYFGGEFWDKPGFYEAHSPIFHVKGVNTPTLILHGDLDPRVPRSQSEEFYNALKRQGCPTQMVVYPRTPHGIEEPRLLVDCMDRNLEWFNRNLKGEKRAKE